MVDYERLVRSLENVADSQLAGDNALVRLAATDVSDAAVEAVSAVLNAAGINVVVESVREGQGDCSLSNYAVLTGHRSYFNVTVDHDEGEKQKKIVDVTMSGRADAVFTQ